MERQGAGTEHENPGFLEFVEPESIYVTLTYSCEGKESVHLIDPKRVGSFLLALTVLEPALVQVRMPTALDVEKAAAQRLGRTLEEYRAGLVAQARTAAAEGRRPPAAGSRRGPTLDQGEAPPHTPLEGAE